MTASAIRGGAVCSAVLCFLICGSALAATRGPDSNAAGPLAQITIGSTPQGVIPANFMGIAHEWGDAQFILGDSGSGTNLIYRNLLGNLTAYGSGPIVVRIGGNSTDTSKEPTANTVRPFAELARATGVHFYLGVNVGAANVKLAVDQARAFAQAMPPGSLDAIEIGNEPDSYVDKGMRSAPYPFPAYLADFDTWRKQVLPLLPAGTRLIGPSWAYPASLKDVGLFLDAEHAYLYAVSQHFYVGNACKGNVNPEDTLLKPGSAVDAPARMRTAAAAAHRYHVAFRVDELNSIACGGQDGLSNAFSSALWAIDIMFEFANAGVDGINWQSPNGAAYSPLQFDVGHSGGSRTYAIKSVSPLYYGMLFFQSATGGHARILPVSTSTAANLKTWATLDDSGNVRVAVINKGAAGGRIRITEPGFQTAFVATLTAPALTSKSGVRFAGQTLDGSPDGTLQGTRQLEAIRSADGTFEIPMQATSAILVDFRR